jgi:hypothetical protein
MAEENTIGGDGSLFIGEHKDLFFGPLTEPEGWNTALQGTYSPSDLSALTIRFVVRRKDNSEDPAIIDRAIDGFTGIYSSVLATNTQQIRVYLTDDELNLFRILPDDAAYRWSLKIMDEPETILGYGDFAPQQATAR